MVEIEGQLRGSGLCFRSSLRDKHQCRSVLPSNQSAHKFVTKVLEVLQEIGPRSKSYPTQAPGACSFSG